MGTEVPTNPLQRAWTRLESLPAWAFIGWLAVLVVLRTGVGWSGTEELERFAREFPHPGGTFRSNAVLGPTIAWATGMDSHTRWLLLHGGLVAVWFAVTVLLLHRRLGTDRSWRVAVVWLTFLSTPPSLLTRLGSYDVFTALGATLVALGGGPLVAALGGACMGATNPEQGALAILCGTGLWWATSRSGDQPASRRALLTRFGAAAAGLVVARALVLLWFARVDAAVQGRGAVLGPLLGDSVLNAVSLGGTGVYAWLGCGWVVVVVTVWRLRHHRARWMVAVVGLVAVPALATVVTLDGSRVFAAVGGIALLVALCWFAELAEQPDSGWILGASAALMLFGWAVPVLVTTYRGGLRVPWLFVVELLGLRS